MSRPLLLCVVLGDLRRIRRRTDDRNFKCVVDYRRDREHRGAVCCADDANDILAFNQFAVLRDGFDGVVLVVTGDEDKFASLDAAFGVDLVDGDFRATLDLDTHKRGRPTQGTGKSELDVLCISAADCRKGHHRNGSSNPCNRATHLYLPAVKLSTIYPSVASFSSCDGSLCCRFSE